MLTNKKGAISKCKSKDNIYLKPIFKGRVWKGAHSWIECAKIFKIGQCLKSKFQPFKRIFGIKEENHESFIKPEHVEKVRCTVSKDFSAKLLRELNG